MQDSPMAFSSEEPGHTPQAPRPKGQRVWCCIDQHLSLAGVSTPQGSAYCLAAENSRQEATSLERQHGKVWSVARIAAGLSDSGTFMQIGGVGFFRSRQGRRVPGGQSRTLRHPASDPLEALPGSHGGSQIPDHAQARIPALGWLHPATLTGREWTARSDRAAHSLRGKPMTGLGPGTDRLVLVQSRRQTASRLTTESRFR